MLLVVVDMQKSFNASNDRTTIDNVANLIKESISKKEYIVFLEYLITIYLLNILYAFL